MCVRDAVDADVVHVGVVRGPELRRGVGPEDREARELPTRVAGARDHPVREQPGRLVGGLGLVRREVLDAAVLGIHKEQIVIERRVHAPDEDPAIRPVGDAARASELRELAPALAVHSDEGEVEVDTVALGVRERERRPVGGERAWLVDRVGIVGQRELGPAGRVEACERVPLVPAGVAREHDAIVDPAPQGARDAILAERELVVQAVRTCDVELHGARVVGEVGQLARREMPDECSGPHPQEGLDRRRHRRASLHAGLVRPRGEGTTMGAVTRTSFDPHERRYAHRMASVRSSAMRDLMAVTERPGMISLAGGFPWTAAFPPELLVELTERVAREGCAEALQYGPTEGLADLRERLAARMRDSGTPTEPSDLLITSGGQQALDLLARVLLDPGDRVICEGPTYPGAVPVLMAAQADVVHVPVDRDGIDPAGLADALQRCDREGRPAKLVYLIPTFQNPSGAALSRERRAAVIELAVRHDVLVVEDDPYAALRFEGEPLPSLRSMDPDGRVIYVGTLSKVLSPGLRIGYVAADHGILAKLNLCKQAADLCSSTLSQRLACVFLDDPRSLALLDAQRDVYRARRDALAGALATELPAGSSWTTPEGGLFLWATLPRGLDSDDLLVRCLSRQVAFVPGRAAYLDGQGARSLRLNFSAVDEDTLREGARRLGAVCGEALELATALEATRAHAQRPA